MPGHENDVLVNHVVRDRDRLLRVAGIVADLELDLLAIDAALGVQVLDRHLGAALHLIAENGILAGHRSGRRDHHIGVRGRGRNAEPGHSAEQHRRQSLHALHSPKDCVISARPRAIAGRLRPSYAIVAASIK